MNNAKWLSMLGLARRAGKLAMGHDLALQSVRDGKGAAGADGAECVAPVGPRV